jgi:ELWxxDGT repeat protein
MKGLTRGGVMVAMALIGALGFTAVASTHASVDTRAVLVKDINPTGTSVRDLTAVDGTLFFTVTDESHGAELWKLDTRKKGKGRARLVKDIKPGGASSSPHRLTNVDGSLYFTADDGVHGDELWRSDGTRKGTRLVKDINPGPASSDPYDLTRSNGRLFFGAYDGLHGCELWRSDGSDAGTTLVKECDPGLGDGYLSELTNVNGTLFFVGAWDPTTRSFPLWKSDGSPSGTAPVRAFAGSYSPSHLTDVNGTLFLTADDGVHGNELWRSDGTPAGTTLVRDINPGPPSSSPNNLTSVNGTVFFNAWDPTTRRHVLWRSDGTAVGTTFLKEVYADEILSVGGTLFFSDSDFTHGDLWRSDGTPAGTKIIKNFNGRYPNVRGLTNVDGKLLFAADDGAHGSELWKSDGTAEGTRLVVDIAPGPLSSRPGELTNVNGVLFFSPSAGVQGNSLWKSDGMPGGTRLVSNVVPVGSDGSEPDALASVDGTVFFTARDGVHGRELWKSRGDAKTTTLVKDINPGTGSSFPGELADVYTGAGLVNVNGTLFFTADDGAHGSELWKSDGTPNGTVMVDDIVPGAAGSWPALLTKVGSRLFFVADDGVHGSELWSSDGTSAGTVLVKDIEPGAEGDYPYGLTAVGDTLYFSAGLRDEVHGSEIWKSDGTAAGTTIVKDIVPGPASSWSLPIGHVADTLFFAKDPFSWRLLEGQLWKSDGTEAGTVLVKDISPSAYRRGAITFDGKLFFVAWDKTTKRNGLWKSDGTEAGTTAVKEGGVPSDAELTDVNGTLFFRAEGTLWKTDGTVAGTTEVFSGGRNGAGTGPYSLTNVNGTLFFGAIGERVPEHDPESEHVYRTYELWKSDGTAGGTTRVSYLAPGGGPTYEPAEQDLHLPVSVDGTLYLSASQSEYEDNVGGLELWKTTPTVRQGR